MKELCRFMKSKIKKYVLMSLGFLALAVGAVGIFFPILPTTPFVICAATCFGASSPKLALKLENNRFFGEYVRNYRNKTGISRKSRIRALVFLWATLIISSLAFRHVHLWITLAVVGIAVTIHILTIRAAKEPRAPASIGSVPNRV
ncbi:MAG: YbaN family protein [Oscillospiraceae bacterium]|nr:YbaN family protein [Oscillospiraceae bacterium]